MKKLQQQYHAFNELADNSKIIEHVEGKNTSPVADVWHAMNKSKRSDASEQGIDKVILILILCE